MRLRLIAAVLLAIAAAGGALADDPSTLVAQLVGNDGRTRAEARQRLIVIGTPALRSLFAPFPSADSAVNNELRYVITTIALRAPREVGKPDEVARLLEQMLGAEFPMEVRVLAVRLLGKRGGDDSIGPLAALLSHPVLGEDARQALSQVPDVRATRALAEAARHASGEWRATLLRTLGERHDPSAFALLKAYTRDWDPATAAAAVEALGMLGTPEVVPPVRDALQSKSPPVRKAAARALLTVASCCQKRGQERQSIALLREVLTPECDEPERIGALAALSRLPGREILPLAIPYLTQGSARVRAAAAMAVHGVPAPEASRALAEALPTAPVLAQYAILRALGERRDPEAFPAILGLVNTDDPALRVAVLGALANTGDLRAAAPLSLALADSGPEIHRAAIDANLRLGDALLAQGNAAGAAAAYQRVFDAEQTEPERIAALNGMARAASPASLDRVRKVLDEGPEPLKDGAIAAAAAIAGSLDAEGKRAEALQLFERTLDLVPTGPRAAAIAEKMKALGIEVDLAGRQGFLTEWRLLGPFGNAANSAWTRKLPPEDRVDLGAEVEIDGARLRWEPYHTTSDQGIIEYDKVFPNFEEKAVYAYAEFDVGQAQDAVLKLGSDDGVVCWLNGRKAHEKNVSRALKVDEDSVPVHLEQGTNRLLLKVMNGKSFWASCARFVSPDGRPIRVTARKP